MCQKCLKVLSSTPAYDCTNPAHRQRCLSYVHASYQCEKPWDIEKYLQKGVWQVQAHRCLLANEYLHSIGLVAPERVVDTLTLHPLTASATNSATASAALQQSTRDREQVEPLQSLWDHSAPLPVPLSDSLCFIPPRGCRWWCYHWCRGSHCYCRSGHSLSIDISPPMSRMDRGSIVWLSVPDFILRAHSPTCQDDGCENCCCYLQSN
jgi:hypothetical protein